MKKTDEETATGTTTNHLEHLPQIVIGLSGKKGCGKDTVADHLVAEHGFTQIALADALKESCTAIFGTPTVAELKADRGLYDQRFIVPITGKQKKGDDILRWTSLTTREILQQFGTECCRNWMRDIWIAGAWTRIVRSGSDRIVISDVRFRNEVLFLQQLGIVSVWRVSRPGQRSKDGHASERNLSRFRGWDARIKNDGTIKRLCKRATRELARAEKSITAENAKLIKRINTVRVEKGV